MSTRSPALTARSRTLSRPAAVLVWALQIGLALMFAFAGTSKLANDPMLVQFFAAIGFGQWFRYFTGTIEVASAVALLTSRFGPVAAIVLMAVMVGAVVAHLVVGGSPAIPIVLFAALATVLYLRWDQLDPRAKISSIITD